MDDCYHVHIEHPGQIEIFENGVLKEKILASTYTMPYDDGVIEICGKECIAKVPVVRIERRLSTEDGEPTDRENAYFITTETYGLDNQPLSISRGFNEKNKKKK